MEPLPTEEDHPINFKIASAASYDSEDQSVELYHDESQSNSSDDEDDSVEFHGGERRLQSMSIMMGDDFTEGANRDSCCSLYWHFWLFLGVFMVFMFLLIEGQLEYQRQAALLYGKDPLYGDYENEECLVYNTETLQLIEEALTNTNNNDTSTFCVEDQMEDCQCRHPYVPSKPKDHISMWAEIATMNAAIVEKFTKHAKADVAILGDSIVEHFNGLDLGYTGGKWKANKRVFDKLFNRQNGGKVNGVALGIGGDRIQNLLYRLQNGEGPAEFHPKVWWIVIGTNDLVDHCNADTIAVGTFHIVEEIRKAHPGSIIVLNSVLPRDEDQKDIFQSPYWNISQEINLKMDCYAKGAKNVEFFNATELFTYKKKGKIVVNPQLMMDPVHPNAEGSRLWGEAIVDRVVELKSMKSHRERKQKHNHGH